MIKLISLQNTLYNSSRHMTPLKNMALFLAKSIFAPMTSLPVSIHGVKRSAAYVVYGAQNAIRRK